MVPDAAGPWDRDETLILMLRPGSTHWEQLELPNLPVLLVELSAYWCVSMKH